MKRLRKVRAFSSGDVGSRSRIIAFLYRLVSSRKLWLVFGVFALFWVILFSYYFFVLDPTDDIAKINSGYYKVAVKKEKAYYTYTKRKPANWARLGEINLKAAHAIVISEDWAFYSHEGVDAYQIRKVLEGKILRNKKWRGASTITQQMVKNLILTNERTLTRKIKEIIIATQLEKGVSKRKILEVYLNIIEYGRDLYGIKKAARYYFNKRPSELNPREGAFLAMLLPNPKVYSKSFREKKLTKWAKKKINSTLKKMVMAHFITREEMIRYKNSKFYWEKREKEEIPPDDGWDLFSGDDSTESSSSESEDKQEDSGSLQEAMDEGEKAGISSLKELKERVEVEVDSINERLDEAVPETEDYDQE